MTIATDPSTLTYEKDIQEHECASLMDVQGAFRDAQPDCFVSVLKEGRWRTLRSSASPEWLRHYLDTLQADVDMERAPHIWGTFAVTCTATEAETDSIPARLVGFDLVVRLRPVSKWTARVKIRSVQSKIPRVVAPEGLDGDAISLV